MSAHYRFFSASGTACRGYTIIKIKGVTYLMRAEIIVVGALSDIHRRWQDPDPCR
jgi:hypothetical protein